MRSLPRDLAALDSGTGRALFREALLGGTMEGYFKLAQQLHTQAEPEYCGLGSLVCALNASRIDPERTWKGPWRWFSEELLTCCKSMQEIRQSGLTLDEVACLASCSGATTSVYRPPLVSIDGFREHIRAVSTDPNGAVIIVNYSRKAVGQTGDGHFSPIGGYHAATDRILVLDTARFKYPPHWMSLELLFEAMREVDRATQRARGWLVLQKPGNVDTDRLVPDCQVRYARAGAPRTGGAGSSIPI